MRKPILLLAVMVVVATACGPGSVALRARIEQARIDAGVGPAIDSPYLDLQAWVESYAACGRAHGRAADPPSFAGETAAEVTYLTRTSAAADDDTAANEIFDDLPGTASSSLNQGKWDRKGVATFRCPDDGLLYATGVMSDFAPIPASGRYVSTVFASSAITQHQGIRYGTAPLCEPGGNDLILDIFEPSGDTLGVRPTLVLIHGGGFVNGDRSRMFAEATAYARRGFVAVSIDYRTCPSGIPDDDLVRRATDAVDDGMEAIRFLHANAAAYGIDITRIATLGSSAGGAISLGTGLISDPTPGGPLAGHPTRPTAVISTGAHLTPALESPGFDADPAPVMMFRYEMDTNAGPADESYMWPYSYRTCNQIHNDGGVCDFIRQDGGGHVTGLGPTAPQSRWTRPWLWEHLDLAAAR